MCLLGSVVIFPHGCRVGSTAENSCGSMENIALAGKTEIRNLTLSCLHGSPGGSAVNPSTGPSRRL